MDVYLKNNYQVEIELGDVFYDSTEDMYYIFTAIGASKYALISTTFDAIYSDEIYNDYDKALISLKSMVKDQYLNHFSEETYDIRLEIIKK